MLHDAGADVVVTNLTQVRVAVEPASAWSLAIEGLDPEQEGIREALCTLGNGYFATRGAVSWSVADDIHYPGTYLAGGYNRLCIDIAGRVVENEDLVNFPNWLALKFRFAEQDWFGAGAVTLLSYRQELDFRRGMLLRSISFEDVQGRLSTLRERRLVSMADMHMSALEVSLTADNWSADVTVRSAIDGCIINAGAKLYRKFNHKYLESLGGKSVGEDGVHLGAMAGTVDLVQRVSNGIEARGDVLRLNPELPLEMRRLDMDIRYRGHSLDLRLTHDSLTVRGHDGAAAPISLCVNGKVDEFVSGTTREFQLSFKKLPASSEVS